VVEIVVDAPDQGPAFAVGTVTDHDRWNPGGTPLKLVSTDNQVAGLTWQAKITVNGPTLNGKTDRGVTQMRIGFLQNLMATTHRGLYELGGNTITAKSEQEGINYWDTINDVQAKWYSSNPAAMFNNPDGAANRKTKNITSTDSPGSGPPLTFSGRNLTGMQLEWNLRLYVAATTVSDPNNNKNPANITYVPQAEADWTFVGTGRITGAQFVWTSNGAGVTAPAAWGGVSVAPKVDGPQFNSVLKKAQWLRV